MKNTFELIYNVVRRIPRGRVATYGQIAALAVRLSSSDRQESPYQLAGQGGARYLI